MVEKVNDFKTGYNSLTEINGKCSEMMMDVGIYVMEADKEYEFYDAEKETAFLMLTGKTLVNFGSENKVMERKNIFDEKPYCLHVPKATKVQITAAVDSELLIQKTDNSGTFDTVFYTPDNVSQSILGDDVWSNTARRVIRTVFDYHNAPYSNMVIGEVITLPGRWSSYPPHHHPQPEVYYFRFDKKAGFGCSIIGDDVYKVTDSSFAAIPGGLCHPQASAPGYAMYYCWMIRHLPNNPWTDRIFDKDHEWLLEDNPDIWEPKV